MVWQEIVFLTNILTPILSRRGRQMVAVVEIRTCYQTLTSKVFLSK